MAAIELHIVKPAHNQGYDRQSPVTFQGRVKLPPELKSASLYYRWYSSLNTDVRKERYSMNHPALTAADTIYTPTQIPIGSQAIAFAVCDQPGETDAEFNAIQYAAVTGSREGDHRCVIHVFRANILSPSNSATVPAGGLELKAEAPWAWDNGDYQTLNRLAYRWLIMPVGMRPGRPGHDSLKLGKERLAFSEGDRSVTYLPRLQDPAYKGSYLITLYVVDKETPEIGQDQASVTVILT